MHLDEIIPQANEPWKIVGTVVASANGCHAAAEIAQALDVDPRQGSYYGNAAEAVGLLDRHGDEAAWSPTSRGAALATTAQLHVGDPDTVADELAGILATDPRVSTLLELDGDALDTAVADMEVDFMRDGLGDNTAARRRSTIVTWLGFVRERTTADAAAVATSVAAALANAPQIRAAREAAEAERLAAEQAAKPRVCTEHFIQLAANGSCSDCDE